MSLHAKHVDVGRDRPFRIDGDTDEVTEDDGIQEVLGFHAEIGEPLGASGAAPIYALAGCRNFNAANDKQCGETEPVMHVSLDSWIGSYSSAYEQMKADYPDIAPLDLGDMGYSGEESVYVHTNLLQEAYENEGLALEFYKSYNVSHHHAKQYFSSTSDIPFGALSRCNATDFSNAQRMSDFVKYSFDYDGVDQQGNGDYVARCPDGHWWPAPACRQNPSECIPLITAGTGWKLQAIMQWAVAYGLPAAVGITASWGDYVALPRAHRVLHYWWVPDSTFIDLGPQPIGMPRHSALEWSMGDKKTSAVGSYVAKMVSQDLSSKARTIQEFVSQITFELKEIMDLLLEVQTEGSRYNVSCAWARQNVARWTAWVPVSTNCYEGFGLADDQGVHVQTRAAASACAVCPEGTFSEEFADNTGKTYRCSACPSGTYQDKVFSSSCKPCSRGTYSDTVGSKECKPCDVAFYQGLEQQMSCMACPADRTTRLLAATREEDCVCKAKFIEREGQCVSCDEETLWCPVGSTISKLQGANGTDDAANPHILEGYFSYPEEPLATYKCRDAMCPGGAPGSCLGGKEGLTCRRCPEGQFASSGPCHDCGDYVGALWVVGLVAMAGGVTGAYYVSSSRYIPKASPIFRALVSGDIAVMVLQNVAVVQVVWGSGTGLEAWLREFQGD
ncbi:Thyroglobulin (Tg) [Durusdinium trenchii]|uniref:Thyroglobulin (Tg) n=1 Tax=Durusdinium trenchii TaxID=1381693 RepID=A0ABP0ND15_9DINO